MNIIRLRLPQSDFNKNPEPSRTFVMPSEFRGIPDFAISDEAYAQAVEAVVERLKLHEAKKIVLSRIISFPRRGISSEGVFNAFNEKFPNAAVFAFTDENNAQWVGATPELLFRKRGHSYSTISLAGTRKTGSLEP